MTFRWVGEKPPSRQWPFVIFYFVPRFQRAQVPKGLPKKVKLRYHPERNLLKTPLKPDLKCLLGDQMNWSELLGVILFLFDFIIFFAYQRILKKRKTKDIPFRILTEGDCHIVERQTHQLLEKHHAEVRRPAAVFSLNIFWRRLHPSQHVFFLSSAVEFDPTISNYEMSMISFEDCPVPSIKGVILDFSLFGLPAYHHSFKGSFQMFARTFGTELKNIAALFRWACVLGMDTWNKSESLSGNESNNYALPLGIFEDDCPLPVGCLSFLEGIVDLQGCSSKGCPIAFLANSSKFTGRLFCLHF